MRMRALALLTLLAPILLVRTATVVAAAETTKLTITVKTQGGKPVDGAEVLVRWKANAKHVRARYGRAVHTTFEMRTRQEGTATVPEIPQGNILIQINAKGYQTFGQVFTITEEEKQIDIVLNPPQQQYSAH